MSGRFRGLLKTMTAGFLTSNGSESVLGVATVDGLFWQAGQVAKKSCPGDFVVFLKTMTAGFSRAMARRVLWVSQLWMVFSAGRSSCKEVMSGRFRGLP